MGLPPYRTLILFLESFSIDSRLSVIFASLWDVGCATARAMCNTNLETERRSSGRQLG